MSQLNNARNACNKCFKDIKYNICEYCNEEYCKNIHCDNYNGLNKHIYRFYQDNTEETEYNICESCIKTKLTVCRGADHLGKRFYIDPNYKEELKDHINNCQKLNKVASDALTKRKEEVIKKEFCGSCLLMIGADMIKVDKCWNCMKIVCYDKDNGCSKYIGGILICIECAETCTQCHNCDELVTDEELSDTICYGCKLIFGKERKMCKECCYVDCNICEGYSCHMFTDGVGCTLHTTIYKNLIEKQKELQDKVEALTKERDEYKEFYDLHIKYKPDGEGASEAETHFKGLLTDNDNTL